MRLVHSIAGLGPLRDSPAPKDLRPSVLDKIKRPQTHRFLHEEVDVHEGGIPDIVPERAAPHIDVDQDVKELVLEVIVGSKGAKGLVGGIAPKGRGKGNSIGVADPRYEVFLGLARNRVHLQTA